MRIIDPGNNISQSGDCIVRDLGVCALSSFIRIPFKKRVDTTDLFFLASGVIEE